MYIYGYYNNTNFISNLSLISNDKKANKFPLTYILSNFDNHILEALRHDDS
jgi:hypothetical protein